MRFWSRGVQLDALSSTEIHLLYGMCGDGNIKFRR